MEEIIRLRNEHPKRFALARIGVAMDDVQNYARSKKCDRSELRSMVAEVSTKIKELCTRYGVSRVELGAYLERNRYALSY